MLVRPVCIRNSRGSRFFELVSKSWCFLVVIGFHNNNSALYPEIQTPNLDKLVQSGIELDNHYAFKFCSPSRCALQTGRNPVHVNVQNVPPENVNPVSGMVVAMK